MMSSPISPRPLTLRQRRLTAMALVALTLASAPAQCQDGNEWDIARARLLAAAPDSIAGAVQQWQALTQSPTAAGFDTLAGFLLAYPDFPDSTRLRLATERAATQTQIDPARLLAYFDRFPPLTNPARARYALALAADGRPEASSVAHAAWRGGAMSDADEAALRARYTFPQSETDARLDSLLWDGATTQAQRLLPSASAPARALASARLALAHDIDPEGPPPAPTPTPYATPPYAPASGGMVQSLPPGYRPGGEDQGPVVQPLPAQGPVVQPLPPGYRPGGEDQGTGSYSGPGRSGGDSGFAAPAPSPYQPNWQPPSAYAPIATLRADPGYLLERARTLAHQGRTADAAQMLATHPALSHPTRDARRWFAIYLAAARASTPATQTALAEAAQTGLAPGADISDQDLPVRDDATSLFWLGGTSALWQLNDGPRAARLFAAYADAARTPQTRAKGYFWAARALEARPSNNALDRQSPAEATRWYAAATRTPDQFYGLLALEHLHQPLPPLASPTPPVSDADRAQFAQRPLARAVAYVARDTDWATTIRFFRALAQSAKTPRDAALTADFARQIGRRDLGVIAAQAAANAGLGTFRDVGFPLIPVPAGTDWTWVHAITRQESQFSQNAVSGAGARGLMQLMVPTAQGAASHLGLSVSASSLTTDPALNMQLGNGYFQHLLTVFNGSYPLAVAAYNAGPGSVGRWLAQNGDPRTGAIDWVDWIERIPVSETRGYVEHVLENAVDYEALYPAHAAYHGPDPMSHYLRGK